MLKIKYLLVTIICSFLFIPNLLAKDNIEIKSITYRVLNIDHQSACQLQEDESYLCPSDTEIKEKTISDWNYDSQLINYGYTY